MTTLRVTSARPRLNRTNAGMIMARPRLNMMNTGMTMVRSRLNLTMIPRARNVNVPSDTQVSQGVERYDLIMTGIGKVARAEKDQKGQSKPLQLSRRLQHRHKLEMRRRCSVM